MSNLKLVYTGVMSQDGKTITITDATGEDNLPLSTKYATGSTNPNFAKGSNVITQFKIKKPDGTIINLQYNNAINSVSPAIPATAQLPIPDSALTLDWDSADLGYSALKFPVGVFIVDVTVWMDVTDGFDSVIVGTSTIQNNGSSLFTSKKVGFGDTTMIKIISQTNSTIIIDTEITAINSDTELVVGEDLIAYGFPTNNDVIIYAGFTKQFAIKSNIPLLECFMPKVAKISVSEKPCCKTCGQFEIDNLMEMFLGMFDVEAQLNVGMYDEANKNIIALDTMCKNLECNSCD